MRITINVPTPLGSKIQDEAKQDGRSVSSFISDIVLTHLRSKEKSKLHQDVLMLGGHTKWSSVNAVLDTLNQLRRGHESRI